MASVKALLELIKLDDELSILTNLEHPEAFELYDRLEPEQLLCDFESVEDLKVFILLVVEDLKYNSFRGRVDRILDSLANFLFGDINK